MSYNFTKAPGITDTEVSIIFDNKNRITIYSSQNHPNNTRIKEELIKSGWDVEDSFTDSVYYVYCKRWFDFERLSQLAKELSEAYSV